MKTNHSIFSALLLLGCSHFGAANKTVPTPDGQLMYEAYCRGSIERCYNYSTDVCGGRFYMVGEMLTSGASTHHYRYNYVCSEFQAEKINSRIQEKKTVPVSVPPPVSPSPQVIIQNNITVKAPEQSPRPTLDPYIDPGF